MSAQEPGAQIAVNLFVTTSSMVVVAPLPGVMPEHVEVTLDGQVLHIRAARDAGPGHDYVVHEWDATRFARRLDLPGGAGWPVTATLAHGQLTITLARTADVPPDQPLVVRPSGTAATDPPDIIDLRPDQEAPAERPGREVP
jgi:HSP20 family molecular chaperone IbpA